MAHVRAVTSFWFCVLHHARSLREEEAAARRAAELLNVPALRALRRAAVTIKSKETDYGAKSVEKVVEHVMNPAGRAVWFDSGRTGQVVSVGVLTTALHFHPDADILAPMRSYVVLPYVAEEREAVLDAFCGLAETLEAAYGTTSVEPSLDTAHNAAGSARPSAADLPTYTVMTPERMRYRNFAGSLLDQIHRGIGGPEWGTFLGPGHLARLPPGALASDAFHQVRPLAHGGAFVRLSEDPMDAQRDVIVGLVERARAALAPILVDVSEVRI